MSRRRAAIALAVALGLAACTSTNTGTGPTTPRTEPSTNGSTSPTVDDTTSTSGTPITAPATAPATAPPPTAAPTTLAPTPVECVRALPLTVRAGQVVWPALYGDEIARRSGDFAEWGVGGAVLMTFADGAKPKDLIALKQAGALPLLIATDEEGGNVQRLKQFGLLPSAQKAATTLTPAEAQAAIAEHGRAIKAIGIDIVFAPVVDVQPPGGGGPIGNRSFGSDPDTVIAYAKAYVAGWRSAGIMPVLKHFPGHGAASADTHQLAASTAPLADLIKRDLLPYAALSGSGAGVMVGHLTVPGLTDREGVPASLSHDAITGLLREQYGYQDALVFTDALGMKAVSNDFGITEASTRALAAGADVVIFTLTDDAPLVIDAIVDAVGNGKLDEARLDDAVLHVLTAKGIDPCSRSAAG